MLATYETKIFKVFLINLKFMNGFTIQHSHYEIVIKQLFLRLLIQTAFFAVRYLKHISFGSLNLDNECRNWCWVGMLALGKLSRLRMKISADTHTVITYGMTKRVLFVLSSFYLPYLCSWHI